MSTLKKSFRAGSVFAFVIFPIMFALGQTAQKPAPSAKDTAAVIMNGKTPRPKPGQRKKLVFQEELSIGETEGSEDYMLGEFIAVNTDDKGNFYVSDLEKKNIKKYDPTGKFLLTIGRQGQGPGEFQNLSNVRFDKNGDLYITDIIPQQIKYFDQRGKYLRQGKLPGMFGDLYLLSGGSFVAALNTQVLSETEVGYEMTVGLFDKDGKLVTSFYTFRRSLHPPGDRSSSSIAKFMASALNDAVFRPVPLQFVDKNELIYFGFADKYEIRVYDATGRKLRTIARAFDPIALGEKDRAWFVDEVVTRYPRLLPGTDAKEIAKYLEFPKTKPAYQTLCVMENGWLLVCAEFIWHEYSLFDLFDDKGVYVGQFKTKLMPNNLFFKNGKAYNVETIDDYKYVKRYAFKIMDY
jgi:hypothetical protein